MKHTTYTPAASHAAAQTVRVSNMTTKRVQMNECTIIKRPTDSSPEAHVSKACLQQTSKSHPSFCVIHCHRACLQCIVHCRVFS